jgi:hypothetical protein
MMDLLVVNIVQQMNLLERNPVHYHLKELIFFTKNKTNEILLRCNKESRPSGPPVGIGCGVNGYSKYRCSPAGVNVGV